MLGETGMKAESGNQELVYVYQCNEFECMCDEPLEENSCEYMPRMDCRFLGEYPVDHRADTPKGRRPSRRRRRHAGISQKKNLV
jgi:hypothetical protein